MNARPKPTGPEKPGAVTDPIRLAIDSAAGVGLAVALAIVFGLDSRARPPAPAQAVETRVETGPLHVASAHPLRLAVSNGRYDDMGRLLTELGEGYHFAPIKLTDLEDAEALAKFDVIFLTCGTSPDSWLGEAVGQGNRPGVVVHRVRADVAERVGRALRSFLAGGGTLYASDYMYSVVGMAFPDAFDEGAPLGAEQTLRAEVVDPGLRDVLGPNLSLTFNLRGWYPASIGALPDRDDPAADGPARDAPAAAETVYLRARYETLSGGQAEAPLLVKVPYRKGAIIFTSFHNESQNSESELRLLRYLVFAAVTARIEAEVARTIVSGGFSPRKSNLLSASAANPTVTRSYRSRKAGRLRFVLGFADRGARLRLTVTGPDGPPRAQEGTSTFTLEVADAPAGDWSYTVEALAVPYPNFPFTLTVAEGE